MKKLNFLNFDGFYNYLLETSETLDRLANGVAVIQPAPMTNADRIRGMSDEELAWELMTWRCEAVAKYHGVESQYPDTQKTILSWLQKQSKENEHGQAYFAGKDNP